MKTKLKVYVAVKHSGAPGGFEIHSVLTERLS